MISGKKTTLPFLLNSIMEICWMYAVAVFSTSAFESYVFPFTGAVIVFASSALIMHLTKGKGLRRIYLIILHAAGFAAASIVTLYLTYHTSYPVTGPGWLAEIFTMDRPALEWLVFIIILLWCLFFWIGGSAASRRTINYYSICTRFDLGIAMFFSLLLLKLLINVKGGIQINDVSLNCVFPFFLISLTALGILKARNGSGTFLPGYRGIGTVAGIAGVILICIAIVFLFLPLFTQIADAGYVVIKSGANFIAPAIISFLRFFLLPRNMRENPPGSSSGTGTQYKLPEGENIPGLAEIIIAWALKIILPALLVIALGFLLYCLFRWMFSRTAAADARTEKKKYTLRWFFRLLSFLSFVYRLILMKLRGYGRASELYQMLLLWGHRSGATRHLNETPLEYGERLGNRFPRLGYEIKSIVSAFNAEIYGGISLSREITANTCSAWRRLRNPCNWPARLRCLLFSNDD